ncbi:MAG TPA: YggS family pyridoxal phosphate-dependent enzyme, partial [Rectinemataceae bacterium]|nr:YggS family pyridoxal phosphate-dependent enzyme [Rectinemataceae bacterium]
MAGYGHIAHNVEVVRARVASACARSGRAAGDVEILAVSKFHPLEAVELAWEAGLRSFGESRVQEAETKYAAARAAHPGLRLDLIGHLQGNKAKKAVELFDMIESVDSLELIETLAARAATAGRRVDILLELHTGEESKQGFRDADALAAGVEAVMGARSINLRGLMTMAPLTDNEAFIRASFRRLRSAFERLREEFV